MTERYMLILNNENEIGIKDNQTSDVIVEKVQQNNNTIGFCQGIVFLLNNQDKEIKAQMNVIEEYQKRCDELFKENIKQERVLTKLIPTIALCNKYKIPIEDLAPTLEEYIERDQ